MKGNAKAILNFDELHTMRYLTCLNENMNMGLREGTCRHSLLDVLTYSSLCLFTPTPSPNNQIVFKPKFLSNNKTLNVEFNFFIFCVHPDWIFWWIFTKNMTIDIKKKIELEAIQTFLTTSGFLMNFEWQREKWTIYWNNSIAH